MPAPTPRLDPKADDGIAITVDLSTVESQLYLDGDYDDTMDASGRIEFTDGLTLTAKTVMTLEATQAYLKMAGETTLTAGAGVVLLNDLLAYNTNRPVVVNADYESHGDGTFTIAAGKTVTSNGGSILVTAWDIDFQGRVVAGGSSLTIHGAAADQSVALGATAKDMQITDAEIGELHGHEHGPIDMNACPASEGLVQYAGHEHGPIDMNACPASEGSVHDEGPSEGTVRHKGSAQSPAYAGHEHGPIFCLEPSILNVLWVVLNILSCRAAEG